MLVKLSNEYRFAETSREAVDWSFAPDQIHKGIQSAQLPPHQQRRLRHKQQSSLA